MKRLSYLCMAAAIGLMVACSDSNGKTETSANDSIPGSTSTAPAAPVPVNTNSSLQAIMDSTVIRMGRIELTNNPTKDFATLMRIHHAGGRKLIQEALNSNTDSTVTKLARSIDQDLRKEVVQLNRFIIDKR